MSYETSNQYNTSYIKPIGDKPSYSKKSPRDARISQVSKSDEKSKYKNSSVDNLTHLVEMCNESNVIYFVSQSSANSYIQEKCIANLPNESPIFSGNLFNNHISISIFEINDIYFSISIIYDNGKAWLIFVPPDEHLLELLWIWRNNNEEKSHYHASITSWIMSSLLVDTDCITRTNNDYDDEEEDNGEPVFDEVTFSYYCQQVLFATLHQAAVRIQSNFRRHVVMKKLRKFPPQRPDSNMMHFRRRLRYQTPPTSMLLENNRRVQAATPSTPKSPQYHDQLTPPLPEYQPISSLYTAETRNKVYLNKNPFPSTMSPFIGGHDAGGRPYKIKVPQLSKNIKAKLIEDCYGYSYPNNKKKRSKSPRSATNSANRTKRPQSENYHSIPLDQYLFGSDAPTIPSRRKPSSGYGRRNQQNSPHRNSLHYVSPPPPGSPFAIARLPTTTNSYDPNILMDTNSSTKSSFHERQLTDTNYCDDDDDDKYSYDSDHDSYSSRNNISSPISAVTTAAANNNNNNNQTSMYDNTQNANNSQESPKDISPSADDGTLGRHKIMDYVNDLINGISTSLGFTKEIVPAAVSSIQNTQCLPENHDNNQNPGNNESHNETVALVVKDPNLVKNIVNTNEEKASIVDKPLLVVIPPNDHKQHHHHRELIIHDMISKLTLETWSTILVTALWNTFLKYEKKKVKATKPPTSHSHHPTKKSHPNSSVTATTTNTTTTTAKGNTLEDKSARIIQRNIKKKINNENIKKATNQNNNDINTNIVKKSECDTDLDRSARIIQRNIKKKINKENIKKETNQNNNDINTNIVKKSECDTDLDRSARIIQRNIKKKLKKTRNKININPSMVVNPEQNVDVDRSAVVIQRFIRKKMSEKKEEEILHHPQGTKETIINKSYTSNNNEEYDQAARVIQRKVRAISREKEWKEKQQAQWQQYLKYMRLIDRTRDPKEVEAALMLSLQVKEGGETLASRALRRLIVRLLKESVKRPFDVSLATVMNVSKSFMKTPAVSKLGLNAILCLCKRKSEAVPNTECPTLRAFLRNKGCEFLVAMSSYYLGDREKVSDHGRGGGGGGGGGTVLDTETKMIPVEEQNDYRMALDMCIQIMTTVGARNVANRELLGHAGACRVLAASLSSHHRDPMLASRSLHLVSVLGRECPANQRRLCESNIGSLFPVLFSLYKSDVVILFSTCEAIDVLCSCPQHLKSSQIALMTERLCTSVGTAIEENWNHLELIEKLSILLVQLSVNFPYGKVFILNSGVMKIVLKSLINLDQSRQAALIAIWLCSCIGTNKWNKNSNLTNCIEFLNSLRRMDKNENDNEIVDISKTVINNLFSNSLTTELVQTSCNYIRILFPRVNPSLTEMKTEF